MTTVCDQGQVIGLLVKEPDHPCVQVHDFCDALQDEVEVLAGLQDGDRLVARPAGLELDGKQIEAQR